MKKLSILYIINKNMKTLRNKHIVKEYKAFTLAEVLITLVIIGVIAAMTVPAILQSTQKQELVSGLRKAHSTLSNALYKMNENNGYPQGDYTYLDDVRFMDEFIRVTNVAKKCSNIDDCWDYTNKYKRLNNSFADTPGGSALNTADGMLWEFHKNAHVYGLSSEDEENMMGRVMVDVNGHRKPNKIGYDVFFFYLVSDKGIVPAGSANTSDCAKNNGGWSCAAKVLNEGKIDY